MTLKIAVPLLWYWSIYTTGQICFRFTYYPTDFKESWFFFFKIRKSFSHSSTWKSVNTSTAQNMWPLCCHSPLCKNIGVSSSQKSGRLYNICEAVRCGATENGGHDGTLGPESLPAALPTTYRPTLFILRNGNMVLATHMSGGRVIAWTTTFWVLV